MALLASLLVACAIAATFPFRLEERIARRAENGQGAEAAREVTRWKESSPDDAGASLADGHVKFHAGDVTEALAAYSRAFELDRRRAGRDVRLRANVLASLDSETARSALVLLAPRLPRSLDRELWRAAEGISYWPRWNAIRMLEARGHTGDIDFTAAFILDLQHAGSCPTRKRAAVKLGEIGDARALEPLAEARRDERNRFCFMGGALDDAERALRAR